MSFCFGLLQIFQYKTIKVGVTISLSEIVWKIFVAFLLTQPGIEEGRNHKFFLHTHQ